MRVLAHVHTFNDADILDQAIVALLRQTRPVDGILVVDNASTDATLDRPMLANAIVVRHEDNSGTSGAIVTGMRFALKHDYDWIWIFDADSIPEPDALEKLLDLYASWPKSLQDETGFLACLPLDVEDRVFFHGKVFTRDGFSRSRPVPDLRYYPCQFTVWSGCLYRLAAVREVGVPNPDYVLDWGETEYGYRMMKRGYMGYLHQDAILHHNIRGYASVVPVEIEHGAATVTVYDYPPIRCYYSCRNRFYFSLYDFAERRLWLVLDAIFGVANLVLSFVVKPRNHGEHRRACFRGIWHGLTGNIAGRY
jgi:GT2 family glycosyltransferase